MAIASHSRLPLPWWRHVVQANTFAQGHLIGVGASGYELAGNEGVPATGWVASATAEDFWLVTLKGEIVDWAAHGRGDVGDYAWLGTAGGYVSSEPAATIKQVILLVHGPDHVQLWPGDPVGK